MSAVCKARPLRADERVAYCWQIQGHAPPAAGANEWQLSADSGDELGFGLYSGGKNLGAPAAPKMICGIAAPLGGESWQMNEPIELIVNKTQLISSLPSGHYRWQGRTHLAAFIINPADAADKLPVSSDDEIMGGGAFGKAQADIKASFYCNITSLGNIKFPQQMELNNGVELKAYADITVNCSKGQYYELWLGNGENFDKLRYMKRIGNIPGRNLIGYSISLRPCGKYNYSTGSCGDIGSGAPQTKTITGTAWLPPNPPAGRYRDSVVITLHW